MSTSDNSTYTSGEGRAFMMPTLEQIMDAVANLPEFEPCICIATDEALSRLPKGSADTAFWGIPVIARQTRAEVIAESRKVQPGKRIILLLDDEIIELLKGWQIDSTQTTEKEPDDAR